MQGGSFLWVVADAKASRRRVDLGVRTPGWVEVKSGLEPGELVVIGGLERLVEGVAVQQTVVDRRSMPGAEGVGGADSARMVP